MTGPYLQKKHKRPTLGFFLGQLEERFQSRVWPSIVGAAATNDANIVCFPGGPINIDYRYMSQRNIIYKYASPENLDGLIIMSGILANFLGTGEINAFCERFQPLPMVSVALPIEGVPSILVDDYQGIRDITTHLIQKHHFKQIAFIRGPENHQEAEQRFRAYRDTLAEHGIPFNPEFVVQGNFALHSGVEATQVLLESHKVQLEAIVASNDRMAMGAMNALSTHGLSVPGDVAVVGLDDIEDAHFTDPPLTTARQPLDTQGKRAVETILAQIAGETVPEQTLLPTKLIVRQSCGCLPSSVTIAPIQAYISPEIHTPLAEALTRQRTQILGEIRDGRIIPSKTFGHLDRDWAEQLLDAYLVDLETETQIEFLLVLNKLLAQATEAGDAISSWQNIITTLRKYSLPGIATYERLLKFEALWEQARVLISEKAEVSQGRTKLRTIEGSLLISEVGQLLLTTFDLDQLTRLIDEGLPRLNIPGCIIAIYDKNTKPTPKVKVILAHKQGSPFPRDIIGQSFLPEELITSDFLDGDEPCKLVIDPLYIQNEQLGLVIFEMGPLNGMTYESLRRQISSSLKGALLLGERERAEDELKNYRDYLEDLVSARTTELINTNRQLQREVEERIRVEERILRFNEELEKRVIDRTALLEATNQELEAFSYSVSHDLRSPLRSINGYAQILLEDFHDLLTADGQKYLKRIRENTEKMDLLIRHLLAISRLGRQEVNRRPTDCQALAKSVIAEFEQETRGRNIQIRVDDLPGCQADPVLLKQVYFNLLGNAIKFSQEQETAEIQIGSTQKEDKTVYFVRDNGVGFDMAQADRLFGVFQRLHHPDAFEGDGIGLATVKRIIGRHGGQIWAESQIGQGSTFFFTVE